MCVRERDRDHILLLVKERRVPSKSFCYMSSLDHEDQYYLQISAYNKSCRYLCG